MFPLLLAPSSPTLDSLDGFSTALNSPTLMSPTLPLSQIIANDAPLLSPTPVVDAYGQPLYSPALMDHYMPYNYAYGLPPSPPNSTGSNGSNSPVPLLRMRMSPDSMSASERDQLCLPTHQVFDFPEGHNPPSPESNSPSPQMARRSLSISSSVPSKRDLSPGPSVSKKARGLGERVTTKDFIPPDVSGLSKREARLVKNRAAAFLSRQRKREEFETMEIRVAELEQENSALRALTQKGNGASSHSNSNDTLLSELDQLRAQLAAAGERERELSAQLERQAEAQRKAIKVEAAESQFSSPRTFPVSVPHTKSGASLGLMVLLCALPSLLGMPTQQNNLPNSFAYPTSVNSGATPSLDFASFQPNDFDWTRTPNGATMDLDVDNQGHITVPAPPSTPSSSRKLEFVDGNSEAMGLGELDISFESSPSENGKVRVRIHTSASNSMSRSSRNASRQRSSSSASSLAMWAGSQADAFASMFSPPGSSSAPLPSSFPPPPSASDRDPFLGTNTAFGLSSPMPMNLPMGEFSSPVGMHQQMFNLGDFSANNAARAGQRRRVRISLKSMPAAGGEGGEWEVEVR